MGSINLDDHSPGRNLSVTIDLHLLRICTMVSVTDRRKGVPVIDDQIFRSF